MKLNEYQAEAAKTAVYPSQGTQQGLNYAVLGLASEAGETAGVLKKSMRGDDDIDPTLRLIKEAGGALWYIATIATELGVTLEELAQLNLDELAKRAENGTLKGSGDDR